MTTAVERLTTALIIAGAPSDMVQRARDGFYDDYRSPWAMPITRLVDDARDNRLEGIAPIAGDFDAGKEGSGAWAASPDGQEALRELMGNPDGAV